MYSVRDTRKPCTQAARSGAVENACLLARNESDCRPAGFLPSDRNTERTNTERTNSEYRNSEPLAGRQRRASAGWIASVARDRPDQGFRFAKQIFVTYGSAEFSPKMTLTAAIQAVRKLSL